MMGEALFAGGTALFFLILAFYNILCTSGIPVIGVGKIAKIKRRKSLKTYNMRIEYMGFGRLKIRRVILFNEYGEALWE